MFLIYIEKAVLLYKIYTKVFWIRGSDTCFIGEPGKIDLPREKGVFPRLGGELIETS